jgi:hypothetical protein
MPAVERLSPDGEDKSPAYVLQFEIMIRRGTVALSFALGRQYGFENLGRTFGLEPAKWYTLRCYRVGGSATLIMVGSEKYSQHVWMGELGENKIGFYFHKDSEVHVRNVQTGVIE